MRSCGISQAIQTNKNTGEKNNVEISEQCAPIVSLVRLEVRGGLLMIYTPQ